MEKETYIYNHLSDFVAEARNEKEKMEQIAQWVYIEFQVNIYFCEIMGKRWSFVAGRNNILSVHHRHQVNSTIGLIAEENDIVSDSWEILLKVIRQLLAD